MCAPTRHCASPFIAKLDALAVMPLAASARTALPPATLPPRSLDGGLCLLGPGASPQPRHHQQLLDQPIARLHRLRLLPLDKLGLLKLLLLDKLGLLRLLPLDRPGLLPLDRPGLLPLDRPGLLPLTRQRSSRLLSVCLGRLTLNLGKLISKALRGCWKTLALFLTLTGCWRTLALFLRLTGWLRWMVAIKEG